MPPMGFTLPLAGSFCLLGAPVGTRKYADWFQDYERLFLDIYVYMKEGIQKLFVDAAFDFSGSFTILNILRSYGTQVFIRCRI